MTDAHGHCKTMNKNTDTEITQAFNKLFDQVKVDCRPLRKEEGRMGELENAGVLEGGAD